LGVWNGRFRFGDECLGWSLEFGFKSWGLGFGWGFRGNLTNQCAIFTHFFQFVPLLPVPLLPVPLLPVPFLPVPFLVPCHIYPKL